MNSFSAIDHKIESEKQEYLNRLYVLDGRENREHPMHSLYTGLFQSRVQELIRADMKVTVNK
jgi:hypothetical protein